MWLPLQGMDTGSETECHPWLVSSGSLLLLPLRSSRRQPRSELVIDPRGALVPLAEATPVLVSVDAKLCMLFNGSQVV